MTNKETIILLKYLSKSFPNQLKFPTGDKTEDKTVIVVWEDWLGDYPLSLVKEATKSATLANPDWVPGPGRVLKEMEKLLDDESETAAEAWEKVLGAIREYDPYYNKKKLMRSLTDLQKKAVMGCGGICAINMRKPGDTFVFNRFVECYDRYREAMTKRKLVKGGGRIQERIQAGTEAA